jgi:hypothetical protein
MGSEHNSIRHRPPSPFRIIAVFIIAVLLLSSLFIFNSPLEVTDFSEASSTRAGEGEENEDSEKGSRDSNRSRENRRDSDNDGIDDDEEVEMRTDPENPDTDSDGIPDGEDYYPLEPSLWRSPIQILMQVVLEILVFLTLIFSYVAYRLVHKRKEKKEE